MTGPPADRGGAGRLHRTPLVLLLLAALAATVAFVLVSLGEARDDEPLAIVEEQEGPFRGNVLPPSLAGAPAPTFRHADARGGRFGTADVAGKPYAVTFLYTDCPDVCPLIGQELRQALELMGPDADEVAVLAVSVDPRGDTPAAVREWLASQDLPANFHYLIGTEEELRPTWEAYFAAPQVPGEPESTHSASIWLVDGEGRLRTKFSAGAPVPPADIAHDLELLAQDAERRGPAAARRG